MLTGKSIRINYLLNLLRVFSAALVGIFTLPYITRVLGAENLGKVEYVNTIINYFILFSALGIPMYAIREVSKLRDNPNKMYTLVAELYSILLATTVISYGILGILLYSTNLFGDYYSLIVVMSGMIILSNMGAEWYFQGTENQLYITLRYVVMRIIIFILFFLLITRPSDYLLYAGLLVILNFGANILNFIIICRKIARQKISFNDLQIERHWKPIFTIFVATISVNIYLQLDNFLIGSISGDRYVGYYSVANKLIRYIISFITIIGAVLLPRLSHLYIHDRENYWRYLTRSFHIFMLFSVPFSVYFLLFSDSVILMMAGEEFSPSILTMRILSPLCIIVCVAYFLGFLILFPQNRERVYTRATVVSAVASISVNYFAIQYYQQDGAAVVAVLAELLAIVMMYYTCRKHSLMPKLTDANFYKIIAAGTAVGILGYFLFFGKVFPATELILLSGLFFAVFFIILFITKESNSRAAVHFVLAKTTKRNAGL